MTTALILSIFAAVIPAVIYGIVFYWVDRYEREPIWLVTLAFLWGAVPAIIISIIGEILLDIPVAREFSKFSATLISVSVVAPVVEEVAKGAALLVIFLFKRQEFDGPLDGLVYGAMIGMGFTMTEDFFYFIDAAETGGLSELGLLIFVRGVIFGLNHACYTGLTGIGFGMARNISHHHWFKRLSWPILGLLAAILFHGLHNFGVSTIDYNALGLFISLIVAMLGILLLFITIMLSWRFERACIREELVGEIGYLLNAEEYHQITKRWSMPLRSRGKTAKAALQRRHLLVKLALQKHRLRHLGSQQEPELAAEILRLRAQLS